MTRGQPSVTERSKPAFPATWTGRTVVGGGSLIGLGGLAEVSPILAVAVTIAGALIAMTAVVTRALPEITAARSVARTAKKACDSPQAERTLRVLKGPEYLDAKAQASTVIGHIVGTPPVAAPGPTAETAPRPEPESKPVKEASPTIRKLAALPSFQTVVRARSDAASAITGMPEKTSLPRKSLAALKADRTVTLMPVSPLTFR